jgi:O-antigen/teichoic acid export membrane protein
MKKKILRNYFTDGFFLNAPLGINAAISLLTLPVTLANLPVDAYGKWQFVLALQVWISAFTAGNITTSSKRGIASGLKGTFFYAFFARLKLLIAAGIITLAVAVYLAVSREGVFPLLFTVTGVYLVTGYLFYSSFSEYLVAIKDFRTLSAWRILITAVSMTGSALTAYLTHNVFFYALFQLGSISILSLSAWVSTVRKERLIESYKEDAIDKECVRYGFRMIPVDLSAVTSGRISHFLIGTFWGFSDLALFSVANKLRDKSVSVIKTIRPLLYADFATLKKDDLTKIIKRLLTRTFIFGIMLTCIFLAVGWFYITYFLPERFHDTLTYYSILVLGLPAAVLATILHTILESHLRYKELTAVGIISDLSRIILVIFFGYIWKVTGVCMALAASVVISFGLYYALTFRREMVLQIINRFSFLKMLMNKEQNENI